MMAKRNYDNDYFSVTKVLDSLRKYGLEHWFKVTPYNQIIEKSKKSLQIGNTIHKTIQMHIELDEMRVETEFADEVLTAIKSFMLFKKEHPEIKLKKAEIQGTSEIYKFNWKLDCLGVENNKLILIDWKSAECKDCHKPIIYPEYKYQASAYTMAYNESYNENIEKAYIIAIAKDKVAYNIETLNKNYIEETFNDLFLPLLKICYLKRERGEMIYEQSIKG